MNKMREISVDKVVINIGVGEPGEPLKRAEQVIKMIVPNKPVQTRAKVKAPTWGIREGLPIGVKVTLRKSKADDFLKKAFQAVDKSIKAKSFDKNGNFGFGIKEYIDLPGTKYDPKIGILGMDVLVSLKRPGFRVRRRKNSNKIGKNHLISKQEAIDFVRNTYGVEVVE